MSAIRPIRPWEKRKLREHLLRLDPDARRARFGGQIKDAAIARFVGGLDRRTSISLGYFEGGAMRASIQLISHPDQWFDGAELSLAVERDWRGRGLGSALIDRAMDAARRRGIEALYLSSMRDNDAMRALAARHGAVMQTDGALEGVIQLPREAALWRRVLRRLFAPGRVVG